MSSAADRSDRSVGASARSPAQGLLHCGIRIDGAVRDTGDRGVETRFTNAARELAQQRLLQKRFDLASRGRALATLVLARLARPGPVPVDRLDELRHTVPRLGGRPQNRSLPGTILGEREHLREVARGLVGAGAIRFVHNEDVGDLKDPRLDRLYVVAEARDGHQTDGVHDADDVDLLLADAHGLDEDDVRPEGVEDVYDARGRASQTSGVPATRHRANEDTVVEESLAHADAVAKDRTPGERTGGIHRDDGDPWRTFAIDPGETVDQSGFATARWAGHPDDLGVSGLRVERAHRLGRAGPVVLDDRQKPRARPLVTAARASEEVAGRRRGHQST